MAAIVAQYESHGLALELNLERDDLLPRESTSPVKSGDVTALSAYNVAAAPFLYATVTEERDAKNRAANDVAQRIRTELAVYLRRAADQAAR